MVLTQLDIGGTLAEAMRLSCAKPKKDTVNLALRPAGPLQQADGARWLILLIGFLAYGNVA